MKIYLDADGSPITTELTKIAKSFDIELIIVKNYLTNIENNYAKIISVDISSDSADFYIANHILPFDIAVTADKALSAMLLSRGAVVFDFFGNRIDENNILFHLNTRHTNKKLRKQGIYSKNKPRKNHDSQVFIDSLTDYIYAYLKGEII